MYRRRVSSTTVRLRCLTALAFIGLNVTIFAQSPTSGRSPNWISPIAPPIGNVQQQKFAKHPLSPGPMSHAPQPQVRFSPVSTSVARVNQTPPVISQPIISNLDPLPGAVPASAGNYLSRPRPVAPAMSEFRFDSTRTAHVPYSQLQQPAFKKPLPRSTVSSPPTNRFGHVLRSFRQPTPASIVPVSFRTESRTNPQQFIDLQALSYETEEDDEDEAKPKLSVAATSHVPEYVVSQCAEGCCEITHEPEWWVSTEALIWWSDSSNLPALATTNPNGNPVLGDPGTSVLFGGRIFNNARPGFRIRAGREFEGYGHIEVEFFRLASQYEDFFAATDGSLVLGRPFFNTQTNQQDAELVGLANGFTGQFRASLESRLFGAAVHLVQVGIEDSYACDSCDVDRYTAKLKIGPRFLSLRESLFMEEFVSQFGIDTQNRLIEDFDTDNTFFGGEIGFQVERQKNRFFYRGGFSLALGATHQELIIGGRTVRQDNGAAAVTFPGALLAQRTNSGVRRRNRFTFVPQSNFTIGWRTKSGWELSAGYNLLYWSDVLRVADQVDTSLNPDLLPPEVANFSGAAAPRVLLNEDSYLAHGISFGIEKRW